MSSLDAVAERVAMMALRIRAALLMGVLAWLAQPAGAQGVLDSIFGYGSRAPYSPYRVSPGGFFSPARPGWGEQSRLLDVEPTYRTLCVRLCDGYYFPISPATPQSRFARDADACSASCGSEARLFYHPSIAGNVENMVDLTGLAYSALPNAFKYRQALVPGCACRPQPWSDAERERHRAYAETPRHPPPVAAVKPPMSEDDDPRIMAAPPPVVQRVYRAPSYLYPYRR
jgi:hypothetical protein